MPCLICHERQCKGCPLGTPSLEEIAQRAQRVRAEAMARKLNSSPKVTPEPSIRECDWLGTTDDDT